MVGGYIYYLVLSNPWYHMRYDIKIESVHKNISAICVPFLQMKKNVNVKILVWKCPAFGE